MRGRIQRKAEDFANYLLRLKTGNGIKMGYLQTNRRSYLVKIAV
ncbi:hypothetical protein CHCC5027_4277 [Bacillus paralicheniformis]|nr:hypothetical protein CHCC5027_4277 [Bacillus paralicheniformis]